MGCAASASASEPTRLDIGDVLRAHGAEYCARHTPSLVERRVLEALSECRTAELGGHLDVCRQCGWQAPSYNSCRNRHCPKCQLGRQRQWLEARRQRLLPTQYFHVVFTLPSELRPLARRHPRLVYELLFQSAARTLQTLANNPARLGAELGITAVLHTWTRELLYHPHVHCLVTGGGLTRDGTRWVAARRKHLFPVRVMSSLYRGKFLAALKDAYRRGEIAVAPESFQTLLNRLYEIDWVVYAKAPFGDPERVFRYLGRYTHRVGLSNARMRAVDAGGVTFATKNGKTVTLAPVEFIRRLLLHALPSGFVKIRHYGLWSSGQAAARKLERARELLGAPVDPPSTVAATTDDKETRRCPHCDAVLECLPLMTQAPVRPPKDSS